MKCENCVRPDPCGGRVNEDGECGLHRTAEEWKREQAETPETLAAILAEMREYDNTPPPKRAWLDLADRIEAAAKRQNHCEKRFDKDGIEMPPHCAFQSLRLDHALAENYAMRTALVEIALICGVGPKEVSAIQIAHICAKALKTK